MAEIRVEEVPARLVAVTAWASDGAGRDELDGEPGALERGAAAVTAAVQQAGGVVVGAPFVWHGGAATHVAEVVVGTPVAGLRVGVVGDAAVEVVERPGGLAAVARHVGVPGSLDGARRELAVWLDVRRLDAADQRWEEHLDGADPDLPVTRLVRPLV